MINHETFKHLNNYYNKYSKKKSRIFHCHFKISRKRLENFKQYGHFSMKKVAWTNSRTILPHPKTRFFKCYMKTITIAQDENLCLKTYWRKYCRKKYVPKV